EFLCPHCGPFESMHAPGEAGRTRRCPTCGADSRRRFSAPLLARTPAPLAAALAAEEKSRDEPEVVTTLPPRRRAPAAPPRPQRPRPPLPRW
ncbi:MAG TPA: zinc ribbon domain-containing protein, partial [Egibacteraceae bacterium]